MYMHTLVTQKSEEIEVAEGRCSCYGGVLLFSSLVVRQIAAVQAAGWTWSACASQSGESEALIWHESTTIPALSVPLFQPQRDGVSMSQTVMRWLQKPKQCYCKWEAYIKSCHHEAEKLPGSIQPENYCLICGTEPPLKSASNSSYNSEMTEKHNIRDTAVVSHSHKLVSCLKLVVGSHFNREHI
ncbi:hypothetical protein VNO80_08724 [Phaseolus coccineus]|uniref:Uncharacterized protein n=1 Tax=Phaseolus coccineus TaxID=3886 RepID=A0AAN9NA46_PHACN